MKFALLFPLELLANHCTGDTVEWMTAVVPEPELSLWLRDRGMLIGSGGLVGCVYVEHSTEV